MENIFLYAHQYSVCFVVCVFMSMCNFDTVGNSFKGVLVIARGKTAGARMQRKTLLSHL